VLLHLDLGHVDEVLALDNDRRGKDRRSLYRYFLSPAEQDGLCRRILGEDPLDNSSDVPRTWKKQASTSAEGQRVRKYLGS
jgi:hypothetical protein